MTKTKRKSGKGGKGSKTPTAKAAKAKAGAAKAQGPVPSPRIMTTQLDLARRQNARSNRRRDRDRDRSRSKKPVSVPVPYPDETLARSLLLLSKLPVSADLLEKVAEDVPAARSKLELEKEKKETKETDLLVHAIKNNKFLGNFLKQMANRGDPQFELLNSIIKIWGKPEYNTTALEYINNEIIEVPPDVKDIYIGIFRDYIYSFISGNLDITWPQFILEGILSYNSETIDQFVEMARNLELHVNDSLKRYPASQREIYLQHFVAHFYILIDGK